MDKIEKLTESCIRTEAILESLAKTSLDHESRLRWLERFISYGIGGLALAYFVVTAYLK